MKMQGETVKHYAELTVYNFLFWSGMFEGSRRCNSIKLYFIDVRTNKMHTKFFHKHDTAD
jgi:hypothetical protein